MSLIPDEPIEQEISRLHGQYARYIARGVTASEQDVAALSDRDFWNVYCDYAMASVSVALRKARLALDYIETMQRHPSYDFVQSLQNGDPVGQAHDATSKQVTWIAQQLNSPLFFVIRAHEVYDKEITLDRNDYDHLRGRFHAEFASYADALIEYTQHEKTPARATQPMPARMVVEKMRVIKRDYAGAAHEQIHNRAALVGKLIAQYAVGREPFYPMVEGGDALSHEFVRSSLVSLSRQVAEVNVLSDAEIATDGDKKLVYPALGLQSLDLNL